MIEEFNVGCEGIVDDILMRSYTADFETTTDIDDCRVWAWGICDIDNPDFFQYGNTIEGFIRWCEQAANCRLYFHNLAFDGAFIMDWLERNDWRWVEDARKRADKTYTTLISDMNQVYCITLYFTPYFKIQIYDSLKIIPLSIEKMAKAYGLSLSKGSIDYEAKREKGHELTSDEIVYLRNDVEIAARALSIFLKQDLTKMTAGSNALHDYKQLCGGNKGFRKLFPELDEKTDAFLRKAYRGGFTYVNPKYQDKSIGEGIVLDVNSLYPSVMAATDGQLLPYGEPLWFDGEYMDDKRMPLWIALVTCRFKIKPDHIPSIQLKGNHLFKATEYIEDSKGECTFCVTNVDWKLIQAQYDVSDVHWHGGYKFKGADWLFSDYVDKWVQVKNQATIDGNAGQRSIAKLMLNSLYGKFATRIEVRSRKPELVDDVIRYIDLPPETRKPVYLPVGIFITSHARYKTITSAQQVYDRFIYADTDSLHLVSTDIPNTIWVDSIALGAWKHETTFKRAKFLHAKCYIEDETGNGDLTIHVAGMPERCHENVTFDNFEIGGEYNGKLYTKRVPGGIVLVEDTMQIRGV